MYTLYGKAGSGSASVEAALAVARQPFRIVETASWAQNDAYAGLLEVNPLGQIPTLVLDDGSALSESAAIRDRARLRTELAARLNEHPSRSLRSLPPGAGQSVGAALPD